MSPLDRRRRRRAALLVLGASVVVVSLTLASFAIPGSPWAPDGRKAMRERATDRLDGFTLSGAAIRSVRPGTAAPVDVVIDNRRSHTLVVWDLGAEVTAVDAPHATSKLGCGPADFRVASMTEPVAVAPRRSSSLSALGIDQSDWPRLAMVDAGRNQDGCVDADLTLTYRARGMEKP